VCKAFHGSGYSQLVKLFKESFRVVKPIEAQGLAGQVGRAFLVGIGPRQYTAAAPPA
jgi:23S rRNA (uridine2552-2'-O)-methyltransferase